MKELSVEDLTSASYLLMRAHLRLNYSDFQVAFRGVKADAEHLWRQYTTTYKNNLLSFMNYLDHIEVDALVRYIHGSKDRWQG